MPFTLERFIAIRPFLFHLTAQGNLNRIMETGVLQPARELPAIGGWNAPRTAPRRDHQLVEIDGQSVWVRDQRPLHAGNIAFENGWDLSRFLAHVDCHVFFWPGSDSGPIKAGMNHFRTYANERPALLRVPTRDLLAVNPGLEPLFCRFNSGAPRTVNGRKSPRGPNTDVSGRHIPVPAGRVQEVVFAGAVQLPTFEATSAYAGPWKVLG